MRNNIQGQLSAYLQSELIQIKALSAQIGTLSSELLLLSQKALICEKASSMRDWILDKLPPDLKKRISLSLYPSSIHSYALVTLTSLAPENPFQYAAVMQIGFSPVYLSYKFQTTQTLFIFIKEVN